MPLPLKADAGSAYSVAPFPSDPPYLAGTSTSSLFSWAHNTLEVPRSHQSPWPSPSCCPLGGTHVNNGRLDSEGKH